MSANQQTRLRRDLPSDPSPPPGESGSLGSDKRDPHATTGPAGSTNRMVSGTGVASVAGGTGGSLVGGGTSGNERLTAATGVLLIVLLAALGVTILRIGPLISPHLFIGLMLIPPVALKMGSTGYRFMRYYTANAVYRERGAPPLALRLMAPIVVASSVAVLASGVALLFASPTSSGTLRTLHKASFIAWIAFTALHILCHLPDIQKTFLTKREGRVEYNELAAGRTGRTISLVGALVAGVVLAIVLVPHFGAWSHFEAFHHHH
ncbi:MAG TPA: hypothetical protein VK672_03770 [Solirubrobacteraceae bacterium]|jgi:hypothetical protein|nr:hypothetical protein [Solirubrobacteraceae bacterium]